MSKFNIERDALLREFFPPERTEPSYGYEIELRASWPNNEDRRDIEILLRVDELLELPDPLFIEGLVARCELLIPDGAVIVSRNAQAIRNLTDEEREEF
jgi:hypothetical protein